MVDDSDDSSSSESGSSEPYETSVIWRELPKQTSASSRYALRTRLHTYQHIIDTSSVHKTKMSVVLSVFWLWVTSFIVHTWDIWQCKKLHQ